MNLLIYPILKTIPSRLIVLGAVFLLSACNSDLAQVTEPNDPRPTGNFEIRSTPPSMLLIEGDQNGLRIPLSLSRSNGHDKPVQLEIRGRSPEDVAFVTSSFSRLTLTPSEDESEAVLKLSISDLPLQPQQREFVIVASDGTDRDEMPISVTVQPTSAPDVYLLVGQSNMVGFSGDGTRQAGPGGADEPHPRIEQLNAAKNDQFEVFVRARDYTSPSVNVIQPSIVTARDPLHIPQDASNDTGKDLEYIGLGMSFAKRALSLTTANIVLVPAAWSGSSFCANDNGPPGNWMPAPSSNPDLGNTLLFDRAVTRANLALRESNGVFRGILWHQGESDSNERCAAVYEDNLVNLVQGFRERIDPVGSADLRRTSSTIPFVLGTMSRGVDEREDLSVFPDSKQRIDDAHRNLPNRAEAVALSIHDDLIPANGYPCGNGSCIHFGPGALREMGQRYHEALLRALAQ